jgi:hypothetical protein
MSQAPLPNSGETANADTRRAFERYTSSRPFPRRLFFADTQTLLDGWIVDLSEGGIGLLVDRDVAEGALLLLELEVKPGAEPVKAGACVVYCEPASDGDGEYRLGCQFIVPLSAADLRAMLD